MELSTQLQLRLCVPSQAHASAAKSAVDSLTRSLALEWGEFGIRTNGIAPGLVTGTPGAKALLN